MFGRSVLHDVGCRHKRVATPKVDDNTAADITGASAALKHPCLLLLHNPGHGTET